MTQIPKEEQLERATALAAAAANGGANAIDRSAFDRKVRGGAFENQDESPFGRGKGEGARIFCLL
jgi:hypothetical protein